MDDLPLKYVYQSCRYDVCLRIVANYVEWQTLRLRYPTLALLQKTTMASSRQVSTFVASLRQRDLVATHPIEGKGRAKMLQPRPALIVGIARDLLALASCRSCDRGPESRTVEDFDPDDLARLLTAALRGRILDLEPLSFPMLASIAGRDCGHLMLVALMRYHYASVDTEDGAAATPSYAALARRFGVSKSHAANLVRHGRSAGWFVAAPDGSGVRVSASTVSEFERSIDVRSEALGALTDALLAFPKARRSQALANG